jgi:hypothetical protein
MGNDACGFIRDGYACGGNCGSGGIGHGAGDAARDLGDERRRHQESCAGNRQEPNREDPGSFGPVIVFAVMHLSHLLTSKLLKHKA